VFCARCGRRLVPGESVGALCLDCFLETTRVICVPERVFFDYCKYCGSYRLGHRWLEGGELPEAVQSFVETYFSDTSRIAPCHSVRGLVESYRLVQAEPLTVPSWRTIYRLVYGITLRGVDGEALQEYRVEVRARPTICPLCKDARGGDYNVLLQIRGAPPEALARRLERLFDSSSQVTGSIVDIVELDDGVDILLLDRGGASKILRELRKHYSVKTVVTGEDVGVTSTGRLRRRQVISATLRERRKRGRR
jgi:nonsense-mediated mRNA decay protein 3